MKIYCTICSKNKDESKNEIEAIKRYKSERIKEVYNKSKKDNVEFRILSGKYGLVKPEDKIGHYDELLTKDKVSQIAQVVSEQVTFQNIKEILFFTKVSNEYKPYQDLIKMVCSELKIKLNIINLK